jgi:hypothetical protein
MYLVSSVFEKKFKNLKLLKILIINNSRISCTKLNLKVKITILMNVTVMWLLTIKFVVVLMFESQEKNTRIKDKFFFCLFWKNSRY